MSPVVQKQPLRQGCLDFRFGQALSALQPDHCRNEVREGRNPLHEDDRDRAEPPITPWPPIQPSSDQIREREQREGHRRHVDPEQDPGVGPLLRRNALPLGNDDSLLVKPCAERDAEVYDEQPQQDLRNILSHLITEACSLRGYHPGLAPRHPNSLPNRPPMSSGYVIGDSVFSVSERLSSLGSESSLPSAALSSLGSRSSLPSGSLSSLGSGSSLPKAALFSLGSRSSA